MKAVIGLGNPGAQYAQTRHNIGFSVVEELARQHGGTFRNKTSVESHLCEIQMHGERVLLVKPQTYMNASGRAVVHILSKYPIQLKDLIVVYDEVDLAFADVRFRQGGSSAGHRGMQSIIDIVPNGVNCARVRIGIGRPPFPDVPLPDFVLGTWTSNEQEKLPEIITAAMEHIETFISN